MNRRLDRLTREEVERMKKFYEYGPMVRRPIDEELARKGWLQTREGDEGEASVYEVSDAAYDKGRPVLYNDAGITKEHWLLESE
jgi:hypothetical protein